MTKFIFKSNASDLQKISQSIETLQKNTLYITYRVDALLKKVNQLVIDKGLQKQVTDFYNADEPPYSEPSHPDDEKDLD